MSTIACGGHHTAAVGDHWQVMTWGGGTSFDFGFGCFVDLCSIFSFQSRWFLMALMCGFWWVLLIFLLLALGAFINLCSGSKREIDSFFFE